jgi:hypothetical protein
MVFKGDRNSRKNTNERSATEKVYPQHLISVTINFLEAAEVDWGEIKKNEELREKLNL